MRQPTYKEVIFQFRTAKIVECVDTKTHLTYKGVCPEPSNKLSRFLRNLLLPDYYGETTSEDYFGRPILCRLWSPYKGFAEIVEHKSIDNKLSQSTGIEIKIYKPQK